MHDAFIYDALRTPIGRGTNIGSLYEVMPVNLLATCINYFDQQHPSIFEQISDCIIGCMTPVGDQGSNIAKAALLNSRPQKFIPGTQINNLEGSGLEAIQLATLKVRAGNDALVLAGGVASMSRIPIGLDQGPAIFKPRLLNQKKLLPKGVAADLYGTLAGYSKAELDQYAFWSYQKAKEKQSHFSEYSYCISIHDDNGLQIIQQDELSLPSSIEDVISADPMNSTLIHQGYGQIALLQYPELSQVSPLHTHMNSAANADAASLILVGSSSFGTSYQLNPKARILAISKSSGNPTISWGATQAAITSCLKNAQLQSQDIDIWECGEPYAAVGLKVMNDLNIEEDRYNVYGGSIAYGQPSGAAGPVLLTQLLEALTIQQKNIGLLALPVSFGTGMAMIIERL